jgi:hypothetical protein
LLQRELTAVVTMLQAESTMPRVASTFPFSRASEAHVELAAGGGTGKILLLPD